LLYGNVHTAHQGEKFIVIRVLNNVDKIQNRAIGEIGFYAVAGKK
jgi:hypothetical protein